MCPVKVLIPGGTGQVGLRMVRLRLGGPVAGGTQYVSWMHDEDLVRAVEFLLERDDVAGPVNIAGTRPRGGPYRASCELVATANS